MEVISMLVEEAERPKQALVLLQLVEEEVQVVQLIFLRHLLVNLEVAAEPLMDLPQVLLVQEVRAVQVLQDEKDPLNMDRLLVPIQVEEPVEVLTDSSRRRQHSLVEQVEVE